MFVAENRWRPGSYIMKVSQEELNAFILAVASEEQRETHSLPELTGEQYDKVDYMWGIMWGVKNGRLKPKEVLREEGNIPRGGDTAIECKDCCNVFIFKERERAFFSQKGYPVPKRCRECRAERKASREEVGR